MTRLRVAVVGAGPAGLSAALTLQDIGHDVVVYEKRPRVGGKCLSVPTRSMRADMGAIAVAPGSKVAALAGRMGRPLIEFNHDEYPSLARLDLKPVFRNSWELARVAVDLLRFEHHYHDWRRRDVRGEGAQLEDRVSLLEYLEMKKLSRLSPILRAFLSGYGYGFSETTPASYFLAYYDVPRPILLRIKKRCFTIDGGYDALWRDVAARLNVRLSSSVTSIIRGEPCIVETDLGTEKFDKIVFACPPDELKMCLDSSGEERDLLDRVNFVSYHSLAFEGRGLPGCCVHLPDWCRPEQAGRPMLWYRPRDADFCQTWSIAPTEMTKETVERCIRDSATELGADIGVTISHRAWRYFPHFPLEASAAGARQQVRSWQGRRNSFFVGEIFSFASAEHVVGHAQALMREFF